MARELRCSFCGKQSSAVRKFIQGPKVYICNECVSQCSKIIRDDDSRGGDIARPSVERIIEIFAAPVEGLSAYGIVEMAARQMQWSGEVTQLGRYVIQLENEIATRDAPADAGSALSVQAAKE